MVGAGINSARPRAWTSKFGGTGAVVGGGAEGCCAYTGADGDAAQAIRNAYKARMEKLLGVAEREVERGSLGALGSPGGASARRAQREVGKFCRRSRSVSRSRT